ncbi:putative P-loop containing nucleoside triphosphate hydrolase, leucine-rich repeat domain superfamily [Helianthus annuus]|nr:putative P-loop containing nucleoside triphosphate hydrolase, leucine-rich repeat domain superfamily [Helianthus annuus]KAJ0798908.1 putative P-loop containing nucleoside triphosphate hydrolase, leucine-rich repeat domain superfamily [Helianthus annuus]
MSLNKKIDSSPRPKRTVNQSAPAPISFSGNSQRSKKLLDEIFVALDRDAELIIKRLVEYRKKVDVVSIVGMGGIGKTTLATKVFNDAYVKYHFDVIAWVTVSQTYDKRAVLTRILKSNHAQLDLVKASDCQLHELVHRHLIDQRYLIVIDDIWDKETWDNLKSLFPGRNNGSRILLTSRITEVAKHASSDGFIHHLRYLNKDQSWQLLCQKVFQGDECPEWSIKPGMRIVEHCHGLPLALVVIAGVLAKHSWSEKFWVEIADRVDSYIVGDQDGCVEILALSYNHLPLHLRECFLYLGGFHEDYKFQVKILIRLWVAEGFIQQTGNQSLEDIAEGYLMDLIDRNLVIVDRWKSNGAVKACKMHDLVRELCWKKAKEERFSLTIEHPMLFHLYDVITPSYKPTVRVFMNTKYIPVIPCLSTQNLRSLFFGYFTLYSDDIARYFRFFMLLRVLDLETYKLDEFPKGMELLVHLRYLRICHSSKKFPSSICYLWNLQTLIYFTKDSDTVVIPGNISDMVNLRHLCSYRPFPGFRVKTSFYLQSIEKPMNLQAISNVELGDGVDNFQKCFPYIKELTCTTYSVEQNDFKSLTYLEKLDLTCRGEIKNPITFPTTLKRLTIRGCDLPWSDMSIIQSLPNLQVLKLGRISFSGTCWNTAEHVFPQLKFLRLEGLNIKLWEAYSRSFPCLKHLEVIRCYNLEEIPLEIGDIPTLELIIINKCRQCVGESVRRIQEGQRDLGNYDLKINVLDDTRNS